MKKNTGDFKTDLEQLLQEGNIIRLKPQGFSMYPLFIPGRDEALIHQVPVTSLKRKRYTGFLTEISLPLRTKAMSLPLNWSGRSGPSISY